MPVSARVADLQQKQKLFSYLYYIPALQHAQTACSAGQSVLLLCVCVACASASSGTLFAAAVALAMAVALLRTQGAQLLLPLLLLKWSSCH
jgi:hypothetical protein